MFYQLYSQYVLNDGCAASFWATVFVVQFVTLMIDRAVWSYLLSQGKLSQIPSRTTVGLPIRELLNITKCLCHKYPDLEGYSSLNETIAFIRVVPLQIHLQSCASLPQHTNVGTSS